MGGECKMHGSDEKFTTQFYLEHLRGIGNLHSLGVGEKCMYLMFIGPCIILIVE